ncbi:MAG: NUDIX domain-containing protein [Candidatus Zhuqueibacterota bacterium]
MKVHLKQKHRILDDFFKVDRAILQHEKFDGTMSEDIVRLNLLRGEACAALLYNPENDTIILVRQFRYPIYTRDENLAWSLEVVAGMIDDDGSPEDAIRREIMEETGYQPSSVKSLFYFYPTPGGSNEIIYLFYAEVEEKDQIARGGGAVGEDENIAVVKLPREKVYDMLHQGEIVDAKTIIALQWFESRKL